MGKPIRLGLAAPAFLLCAAVALVGAVASAASLVSSSVDSTASSLAPAAASATDSVDVSLARRIALSEARKTWGPGAVREAIVAYDFDDTVSAYIFMYKKGATTFPSDEEILKEISDASASLAAARKTLAQAREEAFDSGQVKVVESEGKGTTIKTEKWAAADAAVRALEDKMGGVGAYGTLVISASRSRAPVLKGINGLHSYFTRRVQTQDAATRELGKAPTRVSKVYFSPPEEEMFEFEADTGKVTIGVSPVKRFEVSQMARRPRPAAASAEAVANEQSEHDWVAAKWQEAEKAAEGNK